jgi:hypothetical protein
MKMTLLREFEHKGRQGEKSSRHGDKNEERKEWERHEEKKEGKQEKWGGRKYLRGDGLAHLARYYQEEGREGTEEVRERTTSRERG